MSIYYALAGWSGNRERRNERTKRKREKEKVRSRSKIPISSKPAVRNFVPIRSDCISAFGREILQKYKSDDISLRKLINTVTVKKDLTAWSYEKRI
ncbi:hypothetical protein EVAR_7638_1 [Eumeta japonica]|uniref:Uncharacterized protein n=1 Tax=Eumeta variegata TaxID=151549 RepID=A0A4C1TKS8_EUMVA|nr:hypothetical protein EVAR_7638_1 [Eumeta japonica]